MNRFVRLLLIAMLVTTPWRIAPAADAPPALKVERLADGVYAVMPDKPPGMMVDANNLLIVNDNDVVIVDANGAPSLTRAVMAELRKITDKPVSAVVITHHHDDHVRGLSVWRDAFPHADIIAHDFVARYLPAEGAVNRAGFLRDAPDFAGYLRELTAAGKSLAGGPLSDEERAARAADLVLVDRVLAEGAASVTVLPTLTVDDRLTLIRGQRRIEIRHLGAGHTMGDLVVHLPREGIVATGDLVGWPVPLVGNPQSRVTHWTDTLRALDALGADIVMPGHGPVLQGAAHVKNLIKLFDDLTREVAKARADGKSFDQARAAIDLAVHRERLAGASPMARLLFANYVRGPALEAAWAETESATATVSPGDALAAVTAFHAALANGNAIAAQALLADDARIFESGAAESRAEYVAHHLAADMAFAAAVPRRVLNGNAHCDGNLCIVMQTTRAEGNYKGKAVVFTGTESTVVRQRHGKWQIVHAHWSSGR